MTLFAGILWEGSFLFFGKKLVTIWMGLMSTNYGPKTSVVSMKMV